MWAVIGSTGCSTRRKKLPKLHAWSDRAAELGRNDAVALSAAAMALGLVVRDLDHAVVLLDRSLLLNPNLAASWVRSAWVRFFLGQFDLAIEHASRAMRLSPLDPLLVGMQTAIAFAHFCAGRYDQSATWAERAVKEQPTFAPALRVLAASSASLDRMDEATRALARLREINHRHPYFRAGSFRFGTQSILRSMRRHCEKPDTWKDDIRAGANFHVTPPQSLAVRCS